MKLTQKTFNIISVIALVLALFLTGYFVSEPAWGDDSSLTEQLQVLGYCPPGQTWNQAAANGVDGEDDNGALSTDGDLCTPLSQTTGDLIPSADNVYTLGTSVFRWKSLQLGPGTIFIQDAGTGKQAGLSVENGVLLIDGADSLRIGTFDLLRQVFARFSARRTSPLVLQVTLGFSRWQTASSFQMAPR